MRSMRFQMLAERSEMPLKARAMLVLASGRGRFGRFSPVWAGSCPGVEHGIAVEVVSEVG
jgi:hypothetical protein